MSVLPTQGLVVSWNHAQWNHWNVSMENKAFGLLMDAVMPAADQPRPDPPLSRRTFGECGDRMCKDGSPFVILGGSLHFWRSHPAEWPRRLQLLRQGGFNTVSTYLPWNLLEPHPGVFISTTAHPELDFAAFVREADAAGLLVSIRAGPYITAEHDFGGYPWWLLQQTYGENASRTSTFRTTAPWFTALVDRYWDHIIPPLAALLYTRGAGPIVSFQIDDDSSGPGGECNTSLPTCKYFGYLPYLRDGLRRRGIDVPITTVGFAENARTASVLQTVEDVRSIPYNPAGILASLNDLRQRQPGRPLWVGELYPGHADFVGSVGHYVGDAGNFSASLATVLNAGASVTIYMGSGGSNFGTAGSMLFGSNGSVFSKSVTQSYDFDAPITEAGDPHPHKFPAVRSILSPSDRAKLVPEALPKAAHGRVAMQYQASLLTVKGTQPDVTAASPQTFEELGIGFGFVRYTHTAKFAGEATLNLTALRDRGVVLLNGKLQGVLGSWRTEPPRPHDRRSQLETAAAAAAAAAADSDWQSESVINNGAGTAAFDPPAVITLRSNATQPRQNSIAILVENLGRPCDYGSLRFGLSVGWRGISGPVSLQQHGSAVDASSEQWSMRAIDFNELAKRGRSQIDAEWTAAATAAVATPGGPDDSNSTVGSGSGSGSSRPSRSSSTADAGWQPSLFTAQLMIAPGEEASAGSFVRLEKAEWGSGMVAINGWVLGRFDAASAQRTLYVPRTVLHAGRNDVLVAETNIGDGVHSSRMSRSISLVSAADLGQSVPLKIDDGGWEPLVLGANETALFVDDLVIESSSNVTRKFNTPDTSFAAIRPDAPWEQGYAIGIIGTSVVLIDDELSSKQTTIRVYYTLRNSSLGCGSGDQPPCPKQQGPRPAEPNFEPSAGPIMTAVAESSDGGKSFTKPLLHQFKFRGSSANNLLQPIFNTRHQNYTHITSVFIDPTVPRGSPLRFRGVSGFMSFASSDGYNWTMADKEWDIPRLNGSGGGDTQGVAFWDPPCKCYSFFTRYKFVRPHPPPWFRMVRRARSLKIGSGAIFTNESIVIRADELDNDSHAAVAGNITPPVDFYGATPWWSPRGRVYYMAVVRFWHWGLGGVHEVGGGHSAPGTKDIAMTFSRDGKKFQYLGDREPFLRPTMDGTVGSRDVWLAPPGSVRVGDEELYFVTRSNVAEGVARAIDSSSHAWKSEIAIGKLRVDGMVSMDAPYSRAQDAAVLRTKPLVFHGRRLELNVDASGGGSVFVQVLDARTDRLLLTSVPLSASGVHEEVSWIGSSPHQPDSVSALAQWAGVPIRMVLHLQECKLYSLTVLKTDDVPAELAWLHSRLSEHCYVPVHAENLNCTTNTWDSGSWRTQPFKSVVDPQRNAVYWHKDDPLPFYGEVWGFDQDSIFLRQETFPHFPVPFENASTPWDARPGKFRLFFSPDDAQRLPGGKGRILAPRRLSTSWRHRGNMSAALCWNWTAFEAGRCLRYQTDFLDSDVFITRLSGPWDVSFDGKPTDPKWGADADMRNLHDVVVINQQMAGICGGGPCPTASRERFFFASLANGTRLGIVRWDAATANSSAPDGFTVVSRTLGLHSAECHSTFNSSGFPARREHDMSAARRRPLDSNDS